MGDFLITVLILTMFLLAALCLVLLVIFVNNQFFQNIPTTVYYKGDIIYQGKSAGIDIVSGGDTTTIKINGGFLYLFPKKIYTDKGEYFRVEGEK